MNELEKKLIKMTTSAISASSIISYPRMNWLKLEIIPKKIK
jgi:hypothetical protein